MAPEQADLFDADVPGAGTAAGVATDVGSIPPLAIPCGFRNRRNAPCHRLAVRPVTIDGMPFHHRGRRLLHCDPACFGDESVAAP